MGFLFGGGARPRYPNQYPTMPQQPNQYPQQYPHQTFPIQPQYPVYPQNQHSTLHPGTMYYPDPDAYPYQYDHSNYGYLNPMWNYQQYNPYQQMPIPHQPYIYEDPTTEYRYPEYVGKQKCIEK
ncbi:hypothetical protein [Caldalkalibacillus salinus]|uniref:hypothetical protein n=1 Tax=Caldalkalibacillus salinus TaxID=2803787 RepID=UPI001923CCA8|nr:hypothetical protein [Caldalkalibacillus salinus]